MATAFMKRNHATVWLPPRAVGERAFANDAVLWIAKTQSTGVGMSIERCSLEALEGLKSVNLILDPRDVTLMPAQLPLLPAAKLQKAIPNILEEQILQDPSACSFALSPTAPDGSRTVAIIDRAWLEFVMGAFERRGLGITAVWPVQLTLPLATASWSIACLNDSVAVRSGLFTGLGWNASADPASREQAIEAALTTAHRALPAETPLPTKITAFCDDPAWTGPIERAAQRLGITVKTMGLMSAKACPIDLSESRQASASQRWLANIDWRAWRLPLGLAAASLMVFIVGLNLHWAQLARERTTLKASLERKFKQTFPNTPLVVDPVLQMQRQLGSLRTRSGQSGPDDFEPLLIKMVLSLAGRNDLIAGLEYRDGRVRLRFTPTAVESRTSRDALAEAFRRQGLNLKFDGEGLATALVSPVG